VTGDARLLDHDTLDLLRGRHAAWRLLRAEHAPLILSFLHRVFVAPNARAIAQPELTSRLDDYLFELRERLGEGVYPRSAAEYLDAWASDEAGYLRKYYPAAGGDEPSFDLTPGAEKAIEWVTGLRIRPHDHEGVAPTRPCARQRDPEEAIGPGQGRAGTSAPAQTSLV
jgi:hypothetical protein